MARRNTDRFAVHVTLFALNGTTTGLALCLLPTPPLVALTWGALSLAAQIALMARDSARFDPGTYPSMVPVAEHASPPPIADVVEPMENLFVPVTPRQPAEADPFPLPGQPMPERQLSA